MSINGPSKVTSDGLVACFDAMNIKSYYGSGTNIFDLSKMVPSSTGSLVNGPAYSSAGMGSISFDGVNDYILTTNLAAPFGSGLSESMFTWFYPTAAGQIISELGQATVNTGWHDANIEISSGGAFNFSTWHGSLSNRVTTAAYAFNKWYHLGFSYNGTTLTAYVNGANVGTATFTRTPPYNNGYSLYYGICSQDSTNMTATAYGTGNLAHFSLYKRAVTSDEVLKNYNITKRRFGLT